MLSKTQIITLLENESLVIAEIAPDEITATNASDESAWILLEKSSGKIILLSLVIQSRIADTKQYTFYEGNLKLNPSRSYFRFRHGINWQVLQNNEEKFLSQDSSFMIENFLRTTADRELLSFATLPALNLGYQIQPNQTDTASFNLALTFKFNPDGHFLFDPQASEVKNKREVAIQDALSILADYEAMHAQIISPDIDVFVTNTLNQGEQSSLKADNALADFLMHIINWITGFIADPDGQNLFNSDQKSFLDDHPIIHERHIPQPIKLPQRLFPLEVHLLTHRKLFNQNPQKQSDKNEVSVLNTGLEAHAVPVAPYALMYVYEIESSKLQMALLDQFAREAESALQPLGIKLAISVPNEGGLLSDCEFNSIWVVRMKELVFDRLAASNSSKPERSQYYTIAPVSTRLFDLPATEIYPFEYYQGLTDITTRHDLIDINPEKLINHFLESVQAMRSKSMLETYDLIDILNDDLLSFSVAELQDQVSELLANRITAQISPLLVITGEETSSIPGIEMFKSALLADFHRTYEKAFIFPVHIKPLPKLEDTEAYLPLALTAFSPLNNTLDSSPNDGFYTSTHLPGVEIANNPDRNAAFIAFADPAKSNLKLDFSIKQVKMVSAFPDPELGADAENMNYKWLNLILPDDHLSVITLEDKFPTQLKEYPALPSLIDLSFFHQWAANEAEPVVATEELFSSSLVMAYQPDKFHEHDTYLFEVALNELEKNNQTIQNSPADPALEVFIKKIFQFNFVLENFMSYFKLYLPNISKRTPKTEINALFELLSAFWNLTYEIAKAWPVAVETPQDPKQTATIPSANTIRFHLLERASAGLDGSIFYETVLSNWRGTIPGGTLPLNNYLLPKIEGYTTEIHSIAENTILTSTNEPEKADEPKQIVFRYFKILNGEKIYLSLEECLNIGLREVEISGFYVPGVQFANASVSILRNGDLTNHLATAPAFIFQTKPVHYQNIATPGIVISENIIIPALISPDDRFEDYLKLIFKLLADQPNPENLASQIKININLQYPLPDGNDTPAANIPVVLIPVTEFFIGDKSNDVLAAFVSSFIINWFLVNQSNLNGSSFLINISIFSNNPQKRSPLITLENVQVNTAAISDLASK